MVYKLQVQRTYQAITIGVPKEAKGKIETNIARDPRDRLRMGISGFFSTRSFYSFQFFPDKSERWHILARNMTHTNLRA